jgi:chromosome partitioning protein
MKIIAIANQKGGTGKTSTTVNLGAALVRAGMHVLLVDLDPQASLTEYFLDPAEQPATIYNLLIEGTPLQPLQLGEYINLVPANIDLAAAEVLLPAKTNHERRLSRFLKPYEYDYCLIDCPPSLGVLTRNALTAANTAIIPVATDKMAERTVKLILSTIEDVKESELNPALKVWRILPTLYNARETEDNQTLDELRAKHNGLVYREPVARRANYKKAVRRRMDIGDIDQEQGQYWDTLASALIAESGVL